MKPIKLLIISLLFSSTLFSSISYAARPPLPYNKKILTTIKHIENYGNFIVINLSRDVDNVANCAGPFLEGFDDSITTGKIKTFYLNVSTVKGKNLYAQILTAAATRKKTEFEVASCDSTTSLPVIDAVRVLF